MTQPTDLRALGEQAGILAEYLNYDGTQRVVTSEETYQAILQCMGYEVGDNEALLRAIGVASPLDPDNIANRPAPGRCVSTAERSSKPQLRGIWCNLYSIHSATNWGVGDFGDLRRLIAWAAEIGMAFVAINPLHALRNRGSDVSPYRPVSRLYRNEIYLETEAIPEFSHCEPAQQWMGSVEFRRRLELTREGSNVGYDAVSTWKREILKTLHQTFQQVHVGPKTKRGQEYAEYLKREGEALLGFATFMAIEEQYSTRGGDAIGWWHWPGGLSDSRSTEVQEFRGKHADEVDFHCYVQFELDRQLASLAQMAEDVGIEIGLFGDLAIGTSPDGSDPWAFPELFLQGISIGAPPDDLGPHGQNWGLPPMHPRVLVESDFAYWRKLLQNNLAHMGALRIDHVMGLLRQFWIPDGFDGSKGAYVRFPAERLFPILAEESQRSRTVIVGEDLGTVPEGFRDMLQRFGVLSTRVVQFERDWDGSFKAAAAYPHDAYVVVETHDMAPLAGYAEGRDLVIRRQLGLIENDAELEKSLHGRQRNWEALTSRLIQDRVGDGVSKDDVGSVCSATIRFLAKTPSSMIGISLDDLAGEREPVNIPGVGQDRHPSWSRRMTMTLEEIISSPTIRNALAGR